MLRDVEAVLLLYYVLRMRWKKLIFHDHQFNSYILGQSKVFTVYALKVYAFLCINVYHKDTDQLTLTVMYFFDKDILTDNVLIMHNTSPFSRGIVLISPCLFSKELKSSLFVS